MAKIQVPKTPKNAFNKQRPASNLLKAQVEHLEAIVHPAANPGARAVRRPARPTVRTEGQAAAYIQALTRQLYERAATPMPPAGPVPSVDKAPARRASRRREAARKKPTRSKAR